MSEIICHNKGRYNFYNTISDGFRFIGSIDLDQLETLIKKEHGTTGLSRLPSRLERAHENGHSAIDDGNLDDFLCCNRAGEREEKLTTEECVKRFLS